MFEPARPLPLEPLEEAARFAFREGPRLCDPAHGCMCYHQSWPLLRLLLRDGNAPFGEGFFRLGLSHLAGRDTPRILVSGGADTGVLALAFSLIEAPGAEFVFADLCETPVAMNRNMGERLGRNLTAIAGDVTKLDIAPVDAILAHSFFNFFPPDGWGPLVAAWARMLRPGGRVLLVNHLARSVDTASGLRDREDTAYRGSLVRERLEALNWPDIDPAEAEDVVARMHDQRVQHRRITEGEMRQTFEAAGLTPELLAWDVERVAKGPSSHSDPIRRNGMSGFWARKV